MSYYLRLCKSFAYSSYFYFYFVTDSSVLDEYY